MFKKLAEKDGLTVNVVRPDWAKEEEIEAEKDPNKDHQKNIKNDNTIGFKVQKNRTYYIIVKPASKSKAPVGADYELRIK